MKRFYNLLIKILAFFYFAIAFFYLFIAVFFTKIILPFISIISGNGFASSALVKEKFSIISAGMIESASPILSRILEQNYFLIGILAFFISGIFIAAGMGLWKKQNWARIFAICFSVNYRSAFYPLCQSCSIGHSSAANG